MHEKSRGACVLSNPLINVTLIQPRRGIKTCKGAQRAGVPPGGGQGAPAPVGEEILKAVAEKYIF